MNADHKYPSQLLDKFVLRLRADLRDAVKAAAKANTRSMNAEINHILGGALGIAVSDDEEARPSVGRSHDAETLDRIALALLPDLVRGMQGVPYPDKPKKAIRDAYHTAKLLMAARAEYLSE